MIDPTGAPNPLEKDKAFIGTIFTKNDSKQPLSDEDFIKNQELIDRAIELIIDKAYDKVNLKGIKFPGQGIAQDLLISSPETFNYLSKRLKDSFGYNNLNFTENSTQEKILEIETTQETEQPINKEIKPNIDSSKKIENLKRGDIINFQQQEFLVERVKNEGIDVRDVNTGDVDFISTEDYINETQEQPITEETKEELPGLDNLPDPQCK